MSWLAPTCFHDNKQPSTYHGSLASLSKMSRNAKSMPNLLGAAPGNTDHLKAQGCIPGFLPGTLMTGAQHHRPMTRLQIERHSFTACHPATRSSWGGIIGPLVFSILSNRNLTRTDFTQTFNWTNLINFPRYCSNNSLLNKKSTTHQKKCFCNVSSTRLC